MLLSACSAHRVWFATTHMDLAQYRSAKIGVLPVAVNDTFGATGAPLDAIREAIIHDFGSAGIRVADPVAISESGLGGLQVRFPLTPMRLAEIARQLGFDGMIGISVPAWSMGDGRRGAFIDFLIVFADAAKPEEKRWALSESFSGDNLDEVIEHIRLDIGYRMIVLKWLTLRGQSPFAGGDVYPVDAPFVTISSSVTNLSSGMSLADKVVPLTVTAMDDRGIKSVNVAVSSSAFEWTADALRVQGDKAPIFISSKVSVPLAFGRNVIEVVATAGATSTGTRDLIIQCTTKPQLWIVAVGVEHYSHLKDVQGADTEAILLEHSQTLGRTSVRSASLRGDVTRERVLNLSGKIRSETGSDDQVLAIFSGRLAGGSSSSNVGLQMPDAMPSVPEFGALPLSLVEDVLSPSAWLLDMCSDRDDLAMVRDQLKRSLPSNAIVAVTACTEGVGSLGHAAQEWFARRGGSRKPGSLEDLLSYAETNAAGATRGTRGLSTASR
jgi:hypothetical protein